MSKIDYITPKSIGNSNKQRIIRILQESGNKSRADLSALLNISKTAITKNINRMLEIGIVLERGTENSEMGRKPGILEFNKDFGYVIGVDIVGHSIKIALSNFIGEIIKFNEIPSLYSKGAYVLCNQILKEIEDIIECCGIPKKKISCITIGSPGIYDEVTCKSKYAYFIKDWDEVNLKEKIEGSLKIETIIENDVTLDLIGESWSGSGKNCRNILYIKLGLGLASRIMLKKKIIKGKNNFAGEIGFMLLDSNKKSDKKNIFESKLCNEYASATYKTLSKDTSDKDYTISELINKKECNDQHAKKVIEEILDLFYIVIVNSITVIDPEVIILGGDSSYLCDEDLAYIKERINENLPLNDGIKLIKSELTDKACVYGAIKIGLDRIENIFEKY